MKKPQRITFSDQLILHEYAEIMQDFEDSKEELPAEDAEEIEQEFEDLRNTISADLAFYCDKDIAGLKQFLGPLLWAKLTQQPKGQL